MKPFDTFPHQGQKCLGPLVEKDGSRHGYGLELRKATGQTNCAYCDIDLTETFENWLFMSVDHVVPKSTIKSKNIPRKYIVDRVNCVLCCSACNGYKNCGCPEINKVLIWEVGWSETEFIKLRNDVFSVRRDSIREAREEEKKKYDNQMLELKKEKYQISISVKA